MFPSYDPQLHSALSLCQHLDLIQGDLTKIDQTYDHPSHLINMEELKTLHHDLHKIKQEAKSFYSTDIHDRFIQLYQEYEITVEDVSTLS